MKKKYIALFTAILLTLSGCSLFKQTSTPASTTAASKATTVNTKPEVVISVPNSTTGTSTAPTKEKIALVDLINKQKEAMSKLESYEVTIKGTNKVVDPDKTYTSNRDEVKTVDVKNKLLHAKRTVDGQEFESYMVDNTAYDYANKTWMKSVMPEEQFLSLFKYPDTKIDNVKNEENFEVTESDSGFVIKNIKPITMSDYIAMFQGDNSGPLPEGIVDTTELMFEFKINKDYTTNSIQMDIKETSTGSTVNSIHIFGKYNSIEPIVVPESVKNTRNNR